MALKWNKSDLPSLADKKAEMASKACQDAIYAGIDVELTDGPRHFSLTAHDQTNIDSMFTAVTLGATEYPYHADGDRCEMFPASDIVKLYVAYKSFVTQQTTYCNFLRAWIARETDKEVLGGIAYGSNLPEDLAAQATAILTQASAQIDTIVSNLGQ